MAQSVARRRNAVKGATQQRIHGNSL